MPKLLMMRGLPGSGKSTIARELVVAENYARINRDNLRAMLFNSKWTPKREGAVIAVEKLMAQQFLASGQNVVIDDTNISTRHEDMWREQARQAKAEFTVRNLDTPLAVCVDRDSARERCVGRGVIENMALRAGLIEWDDRPLVICDVDGTVADGSHRVHHVEKKPKDWAAYLSLCGDDTPRQAICNWVKVLALNFQVVFVSGRSADYGNVTDQWLRRHCGTDWTHLFMRDGNDRRDDTVVKMEILARLPKDRVAWVIDDRPRVIRAWREAGLKCYDVGEGVEF